MYGALAVLLTLLEVTATTAPLEKTSLKNITSRYFCNFLNLLNFYNVEKKDEKFTVLFCRDCKEMNQKL